MYKGKNVNVIMPVFNEEPTLSQIITRVLSQPEVDRLIIVEDYSTDTSYEIALNYAKKDKRIMLIPNMANMGKGYSIRRGFEHVQNGIIIIQDADLEYSPADYPKLLAGLQGTGIVLGVRQQNYKYLLQKLANNFHTGLFNLMNGTNLKDVNTCFKVFRKENLMGIVLRQDRFLIEIELLGSMIAKGYQVKEVPISYAARGFKEGKKISYLDALKLTGYIMFGG